MNWQQYWNSGDIVKAEDFCKQVGRTQNQKNYSEKQISVLTARIVDFLKAATEKTVLELACSNGMMTHRIAPHFKSIKAIDFSGRLIEIASAHFAAKNIEYVVGNALELDSEATHYDCILVYFALQYFDTSQARVLFNHFRRLLKPGGLILLGEVADGDRIWRFYQGLSGKWRYYVDRLRSKPIIGHWWKTSDLIKLSEQYGFNATVFYQPDNLPNHYFRYDAVLQFSSSVARP